MRAGRMWRSRSTPKRRRRHTATVKRDRTGEAASPLSHLRLVSLCESSGSCCSLFPLRLISLTERMCAHEKFGFRSEIRRSKLLRGMLIWRKTVRARQGENVKGSVILHRPRGETMDGVLVTDQAFEQEAFPLSIARHRLLSKPSLHGLFRFKRETTRWQV